MLYTRASRALGDHFSRQKPVQIFTRAEMTQKTRIFVKHDFRSGQKLGPFHPNPAVPNHFPGPIDGGKPHFSQSLTRLWPALD
jgi:hypothetical protein